jgi:apolipoprotein N-acyltransferase
MWILPAPALALIFAEGRKAGKASRRRMIKLACAFVMTFFFCSYLVGFTIDVYFAKPIMLLLDLGLILVASIVQGVPQIIALCIGSRLRLPTKYVAVVRVAATALLWTAAEWLSTVGPFAFPVRVLAVSQWKFTPFIQTSSLFGELFISFMIMLTSGLLAVGWMMRNRRLFTVFAVFALALFVLNFSVGVFVTMNNSNADRDKVRILAVQHNQSTTENDYVRFENAYSQANLLLEYNDVDLLVFPESTAQFVRNDTVLRMQLSSLALRYDIDIIVGGANRIPNETDSVSSAEDEEKSSEGSGLVNLGKEKKAGAVLENAVHIFTRDGEMQDYYYAKQQLVPFFENGNIQKFSFFSGDERGVFETSGARIGTVVCFESVLQQTVRDTVRHGAEIIVVPSNDAYLGEEIRTMHIAQSVFRAIETNRAVVQVATNGVTALTNPNGSMAAAPMNEQTALIAEVYPSDSETLYVKFGNSWIIIAGALLALYMIADLIWGRRGKSIAESFEKEL